MTILSFIKFNSKINYEMFIQLKSINQKRTSFDKSLLDKIIEAIIVEKNKNFSVKTIKNTIIW